MQMSRRFSSVLNVMLAVVWSFAATSTIEAQAVAKPEDEVPFIGGSWYSYFGIMEIEQNGRAFTGTYSCCEGEIEGQMIGQRIDYTWKDAVYGEGWGFFFLEGNGNKLNGTWGEKDDLGGAGEWGAVRMVEAKYEGTLSHWRVVNDHRRFGWLQDGLALLATAGERVEGKLVGHYMTESGEKPYRVDLFLYLDGELDGETYRLEWEDPRFGLFGKITLQRDGEILRGEWEPHGDYGQIAEIVFEPAATERSRRVGTR